MPGLRHTKIIHPDWEVWNRPADRRFPERGPPPDGHGDTAGMIATPTTTVTVLRGTTTTAHGDTVDTAAAVAGMTNLPASIVEQRQDVNGPQVGRNTEVRHYVGKLAQGTDVREGDRLRDDVTEHIYLVTAVISADPQVTPADLRLDLRRVT